MFRCTQTRLFNRRKSGPPETEKETADPLWFHEMKAPTYDTEFRCFIGLGSNLGGAGRLRYIERALIELRNVATIVNTSALYESMPENNDPREDRYINAVVEITTALSPHELLKATQSIEVSQGRPAPGQEGRGGSRVIDIDILTYGDSKIDKDDLIVPHPRIHLRDFVIRPLADIDPSFKIPGQRRSVSQLFDAMQEADQDSEPSGGESAGASAARLQVVRPFIPTARSGAGNSFDGHRQSLYGRQGSHLSFQKEVLPALMGVVNVTPDSFSDGGKFVDVDQAYSHCLRLLADGASILDIGGVSTRPGAQPVDPQEEMDRVLPLLERVHKELNADDPMSYTICSVDTNSPKVAQEALAMGADWINDVFGGQDGDMIRAIADRYVFVSLRLIFSFSSVFVDVFPFVSILVSFSILFAKLSAG